MRAHPYGTQFPIACRAAPGLRNERVIASGSPPILSALREEARMEPGDDAVVERARSLAPLIRARRDEGEDLRRMPDALVEAVAGENLFRLFVPQSLGGLEAQPATLVRTIEALSIEDGATGWNTTIAAGTGIFAGLVPDDVARPIWAPPANGATAGSLQP